MAIVKLIGEADHIKWWCPGCDGVHVVPVRHHPSSWEWNGSLDSPTLSPSILVEPHRTFINGDLQEPALTNEANVAMTPLCHSFIRSGQIEYLTDCTHELAGQTTPMVGIR